MDPDFTSLHHKRLEDLRVAIFGLGLMGGSLALGLRGKCAGLWGVDPDPEARRLAQETGVFTAVTDLAAQFPFETDLLILAAPVGAILRLLDGLPALVANPAAVLDLGSTKRSIVEKMAELPPRFDPLGGHPMCGKEVGGLANADASIFRAAAFGFTPLERTSPWLRARAAELAQALDARPLWLDPLTHDRWAAWTSHLPYLAAGALAGAVPAEAAPLAGSGLRSTVRLAATPWSMMRDVLETNRLNLLASLQAYRASLQELEALLEQNDFAELETRLAAGAARQQALVKLGAGSR
ncbi:MAG: prephenate dehydrogenase [Anaerolineae bacterium]|jgi:prephenate dehydrogenase|nr:prephenate dehydrogenase [Anaerolineae bacterium]MCZ7553284.1 prephenate dehydrogenase [Anaerolineales bacterium]